MKSFTILLTLTILTSCASVPNPKNASEVLNSGACKYNTAFNYETCDKARNLVRVKKIEKFISENPEYSVYKDTVINKKIKVGLPEELLLLSWGKPKNINETVYEYGSRKQYVYSNDYIYVEDGKITSWQSHRR